MKYRNIRSALLAVSMIIYFILAFFVKNPSLNWMTNVFLLLSIGLGVAILLLDVRKLTTSNRKIFSFVILLLLAIGLLFAIDNIGYSFNTPVRVLIVLAFVIVYALFLNYDVFKIEYK